MSLRVEATGPQLLIQDQGRAGSAHLGVPPSGALDRRALALGNRLVGNEEGAAGLEVLLGGVRLVAAGSTRIALVGAQLPLLVGGRAMAWGEAVSVRAGDRIEVGTSPDGLRSWLAFAGGITVEPVLQSRATDTFSGLGPPAVAEGDTLPLGELPAPGTPADAIPGASPLQGVSWLDLAFGPRDDWFTSTALERLLETEYVVSPESNRTGLRLDGGAQGRLERRVDHELPSEGVVNGAVQVPSSGQPLVFLADHPVTGGYPVVGVIDPPALALCAQLRPGAQVRFRRSPARPPRRS